MSNTSCGREDGALHIKSFPLAAFGNAMVSVSGIPPHNIAISLSKPVQEMSCV